MLRLALILTFFGGSVMAADFKVLEGHGGPVQAVALAPDGVTVLTASFDNSVGVWRLGSDDVRWLEGHKAAVKSVVAVSDSMAVSAGDDFAIEIWDIQKAESIARLEGHRGNIKSLAVSPDGSRLASASWDGTARLWSLPDGSFLAELDGHAGPVNDVAFSQDGVTVYTASTDGKIRSFDPASGDETRVLTRHGFGVTELISGPGWLAYGAVDGGTRVIDLDTGDVLADLTLDRRPILSMALSPDGSEFAVGDGEGYVMTVSTETWSITGDYRAAANGPVWALAYTADGAGLIGAGIDDAAFVWPAHNDLDAPIMATKTRKFLRDPSEMGNGERQFARKCSICHSLADDGVRRAGPTLAGIMGRPAGSISDYAYSSTVSGLGFNWDETTIDQLFDLGPDHFIPGSKMPMQRIVRPEDRRDLIEFLRDNT